MRIAFLISLTLVSSCLLGQTIGGSSVFNFLRLPGTPQLTALGGVNVSVTSNDVGLAFNNPALLKNEMHTQMNAVFNSFYAGINAWHLSLAYRQEKLKTNFGWGLTYFDYGRIDETDASGNILGQMTPTDWMMQVSASRTYLQKWKYGTAMKFISSNYGVYRSNGIALDAGVLYLDTATLFSASVVVKNMGYQLKKYAGTEAEELPFDLQAGLTKTLKNAPISFSITAHHLHQFDIRYNDTLFDNENFGRNETGKFSFDKIFRHFVLASQILPIPQLEITIAYNHLLRQELNINNTTNGLNGFSVGVGLIVKKLAVRYARTHYQNHTGYNQLGLNLQLNQYFGLGKFGEKIGW
ncbi:MAG TPA: type IX secretion system protein PorQ [Chitinophagaceae bacterium]|nr:type IX secretion system protein PorQ [Chitinophagaceae bacterium]